MLPQYATEGGQLLELTDLSLLFQGSLLRFQCCHANIIIAGLKGIIYAPFVTTTHVDQCLAGVGDSGSEVRWLVTRVVVVSPRQMFEVSEDG